MNLNQLAVFNEVMKTGSLSQAARNLGRTQPAVSLALKSLEDSLGVALFERKGRALLPVPEAQYLREEAQEILGHVQQVSQTLENLKTRQSGTLNIAAMPGPSALLFPRFLADQLRDRPDIRVTMTTRSSPQIVQLVSSQSLDFGFADGRQVPSSSGQYDADVFSAHCLCAVPADHPLADQQEITVKDLAGKPLGVLLSEHFSHKRTREIFAAAGAAMNVRLESQNYLPIMQFVELGQCFSIVDPLSAKTYMVQNGAAGRVVFRRFAPAIPFDYAIYVPSHRPMSRLAAEMRDAWKAHVISILEELGVLVPSGSS